MKVKKIIPAFLILFISICLAVGVAGEKLQKKESGERETRSLIRKELLVKETKKLGPPRRNIFSVHRSVSREIEADEFKLQQNHQEVRALSREEASRIPLDIRYVGYIISGEKITALIIFEGNAIAVEKGEMISEGVKIGEIKLTEIEIIGSDSEKRKYPLEGEKE